MKGERAMKDQRTQGTINKARGTVEAAIGKATGDPVEEALGHARKAQGGAQQGIGDIAAAARKDNAKPR